MTWLTKVKEVETVIVMRNVYSAATAEKATTGALYPRLNDFTVL